MDLRRLDELLNPINFPGDPDINGRVRSELAVAINAYLSGKAQLISSESILDTVERPQKWRLTFTKISCTSAGGWEKDQAIELSGSIKVGVKSNPGKASVKPMTVLDKALNVSCKPGSRPLGASQVIEGRPSQLAGVRLTANANMVELDYAGALDPDDDVKGASPAITLPASGASAVGVSVNGEWRMPHSDSAKILLHWTFTRLQ